MKKYLSYAFLPAVLSVSVAWGQNNPNFTETYKAAGLDLSSIDENPSAEPRVLKKKKSATNTSAVVLWSEDFSNGIPSNWVNQGYAVDPNTNVAVPHAMANWEYRGPNTTPSNSVGSRGAWVGTRGPINSPSQSNGFVIFDSDYLDNNGVQGARGTGVAVAPHLGTLTTDTIDLTGYPHVELAFSSYAREFQADFWVAVSNDGGLTFPDTAEFHDIGVNTTSPNGDEVIANISNTAGDEPMVVLQFIFDGRPSNSNGHGYYFWMFDDVVIRDLPPHSFQFTDYGDAPAHNVLYPEKSPKYGHIPLTQAAPITFDSNFLNYGYMDQTNVKLIVEIEDAAGNSVASLSSAPLPVMASGDTGTYNHFKTSTGWTPSAAGKYNVIFTIQSDSIPTSPTAEVPYDTMVIHVSDETYNDGKYSFSFGSIDNFVGTDNLASGEITAIGEAFNFPNPNKDTTGYVFIDGMSVPFSTATDPTTVILWEAYDTTGFSYGTPGGPAGSPVFTSPVFSLDSTAPGTTHYFDFRSIAGTDTLPLALPSGHGYHFIMYMIPGAADGVVRIGNDQTITQPITDGVKSVVVQTDRPSWFGYFNNSSNLSSPVLNLFMADIETQDTTSDNSIIRSLKLQNLLKAYPNPSTGKVFIEISEGGTYDLELVNTAGKRQHFESVTVNAKEKLERNFAHLPTGIYILNISNEDFRSTRRITIE